MKLRIKKLANNFRVYTFLSLIFFTILISLLINYIASYQLIVHTDFCQDYQSAKLFMSGQPIYQIINCWPAGEKYQLYNPHPPFNIYLYVPFLLFNVRTAGFIWGNISIFLYFYSLILILKIFKKFNLKNTAVFFISNLIWPPFYLAINNQNIIMLLFFMLTLAWYWIIKKEYIFAGITIGLATLLRFWPILFLVPFFIAKKNRLVISTLATIAIGTVFTTLNNGFHNYQLLFGVVHKAENLYLSHVSNLSSVTLFIFVFEKLKLDQAHLILISQLISITIFIFLLIILYKNTWRNISKLNIKVLSVSVSFSFTTIFFIFPVLWEWILLISILTYAMIFYVIRTNTLPPKSWYNLLNLSMFFIFISRMSSFYLLNISFSNNFNSLLFIFSNNFLNLTGILLLLISQIKLIKYIK